MMDANTTGMPKQGKLYLGIDVGGTNTKLGLVDSDGVMHAKDSTATPPLKTPDNVFAYAMEFASEQLNEFSGSSAELAGVGLAVPGVLDSREFVLREVVNLPGWLGRPLLEILTETSKLTSAVVNDANSAAYAEHALRGLGKQSLALVTLGTGIGCGIVAEGSPYGGDHGCAGELGHIAIRFGPDAPPCSCGSRGHLESYAGAAGVISRMRAALVRDKLDERAGDSIHEYLMADNVTPRDIATAADQGSEVCREIIDQTADYVGQAVGMLGQVIDPAVVLLGGAMTFGGRKTETGMRFLNQVRQSVQETTLVQVGENIVIDFASLGNDAGVLGAAMIAKQASEQ